MQRDLLLFVFLIQLWILTPASDKGCSGFRHVENGRTFFRYGGLYVTFTCNPGFRIHGYRTSSCVSGQWARNPPLCVASGCPSPGDLLHGSTVVSQDRSLAFFHCDFGFSLFGSALLYCKGKIWNGTKPVCKVADIMSVYLNAHGSVSAQDIDAPVSLKVHLHGNLNTLAVTAPKEVFHKSAFLGVPHIKPAFKGDKQENIRNTLEIKPLKKLWSEKTLTQHKGEVDIKAPINNFENVKVPFRNVDVQKYLPVDSSNVSTISSSHLGAFLHESSFTTPLTKVKGTTGKIVDQSFTKTSSKGNKKDLQSAVGANRPSQSTLVTSAVESLSTYVPVYSQLMSNINTPDTIVSSTDKIQSVTIISNASYKATTVGSPTKSTFLEFTTDRTVSSNCRRLCDQKSELQVTSSPPGTIVHTSASNMEVLTATHLLSDVPQRKANGISRPNLLSQFLRNITLSTSINYGQEYERSNGSATHTFDSPAWKVLEFPRFPTRKHRPVCPYPPLPSHGTFYFQSVKNPSPHQYKHYIQYACYPGYTLTGGDVYSYCQHNGQWSGKTPLCLALTPCSLNNGGCSQICQDIGENQAQCLCKPGFLLLEDQRTCRDLDECVEQFHLCQQACENTLGSYRCDCNPGFQLSPDRTSCFNINECEQMQLNRCEWKCVNLPDTHRCICPRGYRLHPNGYHCEDMNECEWKNGGCSHLCINHRGSYKCACPETHRISPYNQKICLPVHAQTSSSQ